MNKLLIIISFTLLSALSIDAQDSDTVWTRDLWQLGSQIEQIQFTPDGDHIAVAIGGGVYILDKNTGEFVKQFNKYMTSCNSFVIFDNLNWLVTTSDANRVIIWDWLTSDTVKIFNNIRIFSIKRYGENSIIGIGNSVNEWKEEDSTRIDVIDLITGDIIKRQRPKNSNLYYGFSLLEISKTNNLIALQSYDKISMDYQIELFDITSLEHLKTLALYKGTINDLSFSNDGKYLASASSDGIIKIWDVQEKKLVKSFNFDENLTDPNASFVRFSPKSGYLIAGGGVFGKYSTKIWKLPNFEKIYDYIYGASYGLAISEDSSFIAVGKSRELILLNSHWTPTGIINTLEKTAQYLYPNPAGSLITVPLEADLKPISVNLSNTSSQIVKTICQIEFMTTSLRIEISDLLHGVYFVSVLYPTKTVFFKFEKIN